MVTPHLPDDRHVPSRLDLQLDPPIAETNELLDALEQPGDLGLDPEAHAGRDPVLDASEKARDGFTPRPRDQVDEGELQTGAGHRVTPEGREPLRELGQARERRLQDRGREVVAHDVQGRPDRFVAVQGFLAGDDLSPPLETLRLQLHENDQPRPHPAEARLERLDEIQAEKPELDRLDPEGRARQQRRERRAHSDRPIGARRRCPRALPSSTSNNICCRKVPERRAKRQEGTAIRQSQTGPKGSLHHLLQGARLAHRYRLCANVALAAGSRLGPYEILAPIGAGGMGEVYRARDPRLGREVAIKVLPASFSQDADRLRRFEQEAQAAGVLNHPNITAVYDIGTHDGAPYIVQELLEGETLRAALAGGALSPRKAIDYALQIAQGLAAAHEKGIVHRDLKPENLFVTKDGRVKILDFGLAKLTQPEERRRRRPTCRRRPRAPSPASSWARSATCRPSRCAASPPTRAPTSSPSARSSTRCSRASARSTATRRRTRCRRS